MLLLDQAASTPYNPQRFGVAVHWQDVSDLIHLPYLVRLPYPRPGCRAVFTALLAFALVGLLGRPDDLRHCGLTSRDDSRACVRAPDHPGPLLFAAG